LNAIGRTEIPVSCKHLEGQHPDKVQCRLDGVVTIPAVYTFPGQEIDGTTTEPRLEGTEKTTLIGCIEASANPIFKLKNFELSIRGFGDPRTFSDSASAILTNTATQVSVLCNLEDVGLFSASGGGWMDCIRSNGGTADSGTSVWLAVDISNNMFYVNQTWRCSENDGGSVKM
jgi:hypothetical protein